MVIKIIRPTSFKSQIRAYTRALKLGSWLDRVAVKGEVVVQFWLKPGEAVVTLGAEKDLYPWPI